jgi:hypothetical protein
MKKLYFILLCLAVLSCAATPIKEPVPEKKKIVTSDKLKVGDTVIYILTVEENGKTIAFFKPDYFIKGEIIKISGKVSEALYTVDWANGEQSVLSAKNLGRYRPKK